MHAVGEWESHDGPLPTVEGCVDGITYKGFDDLGRTIITAQCSTCYRTYTDLMVLALRAVSFARQGEFGGAEPFRRCAECREAGILPENADALRGQQRCMKFERQKIVRSDDYRKALQVESSIHSSPQEREIAYHRMVDMLKTADDRGMQRWAEKCADSTPSLTARNAGQLPATG